MRVRVSPPAPYNRTMDLLGNRRLYWSWQNGFIVFNKNTGEIFVRGVKQTSQRYAQLWADALGQCPSAAQSKHILLLGLAGGGLLPALRHYCKSADVTAIEHDATMIRLAKKLYSGDSFPTVIQGDAQVEVARLAKKFDLVLVDLFLGANPPTFVKDAAFWSSIKKVLAPVGSVILNLAGSEDYESTARACFSNSKAFTVRENRFVVLWDETPHTTL